MAKKEKKSRGPQYMPSLLSRPMLNYSEYYMSKGERLLYSLLLMVAGALVGFVFYGGLFKEDQQATMATYISDTVVCAGVGLLAIKFFLPAVNGFLKEKRAKNLQRQFMNMLECLSTGLSSGSTMFDAVVHAKEDLLNQYSETDMIIVELSEIVSSVSNGRNLEEAIENFGARSANEDILNFGNVIRNCYRLGGNFNDVVRHTREIISDKFAVADEIQTKVSSNKLQLNAMCLMPIALVGLLKISNPAFSENLGSAVGVLVTTVSIGIFVASYIWGQKIIKIG